MAVTQRATNSASKIAPKALRILIMFLLLHGPKHMLSRLRSFANCAAKQWATTGREISNCDVRVGGSVRSMVTRTRRGKVPAPYPQITPITQIQLRTRIVSVFVSHKMEICVIGVICGLTMLDL